MDIFEDESDDEFDEEMEDIEGDILDLYEDMNGKSNEELAKSRSGYERTYKKILYSLRDVFDRNILGAGTPIYLQELINEIDDSSLVLSTTTITRIKMGIKKISRKLKIELPENKESNKNSVPSSQQIIFNANPIMNTTINLSNETKVKVETLIEDFKKELDKEKPNKRNLLDIFKGILKLLGIILG
jgi:hypothetical protein